MEIKIPFQKDMAIAAIKEYKTTTTRTRRYADIGDTFYLEQYNRAHVFVITDIKRLTLAEVAYQYHRQEGFNSVEGFVNKWCQIHPIKRFVHNQLVWLHFFRKQVKCRHIKTPAKIHA